jgi:hypothetical protein
MKLNKGTALFLQQHSSKSHIKEIFMNMYNEPTEENAIAICHIDSASLDFYIENPTQAVINYNRLYWS